MIGIIKNDDPTPILTQAQETIRVNFTSTLNVCNALFPLLRPHARVVNVASRLGMLSFITDTDVQRKLASENLTVGQVQNILNDFIE
jgi:carbonyl reductase 1